MSIEEEDRACATHAVAPRVTIEDIKNAIAARYDFTAAEAVGGLKALSIASYEALSVLSVCIVVLKNGYTVIGKSAPASKANFNAAFGAKLAYDDCLRQMWPLMGFALRDKIAESARILEQSLELKGGKFIQVDDEGFIVLADAQAPESGA